MLIDNTRRHPFNFNATGVSGFQALVDLQSVRITRMPADGIRLEHEDSKLVATGVVIDRIGPTSGPASLGGGIMSVGPPADLRGVRVHKARPFGVALAGPTADGLLYGVIVDEIGSAQLFTGGSGGVLVANGARAKVRSLRVHDARHIGLALEATGTHADARFVTITATRPEELSGQGGIGAAASAGATLNLRNSRVHDARASGILVFANSALTGEDVVVDGTRGSKYVPNGGLGVAIDQGARATIQRWRLRDNRTNAIQVQRPGSRLVARRVHVDGTRPSPSGRGGGGLSVIAGGNARLLGGRFVDNRQIGAVVRFPGSSLAVSGLLVEATRAGSKGLGMGMVAAHGGRLIVQGSHVVDSRIAGIHALGPDNTTTVVVGTIVEKTAPGNVTARPGAPTGVVANLEGIGISAFRGPQRVDVVGCLARQNHTAGMALTGVSGSVVGSVIASTVASQYERPGPGGSVYVKLADGILVHSPTDVLIRSTIAVNQARAGILLDGKGNASVDQCAVTSSLFGLVQQAGIATKLGRNVLWGNQSNRASDTQLYIPPSPGPIEL